MTKDDFLTCMDITKAINLRLEEMGIDFDPAIAAMALESCHRKACALKLDEMLAVARGDDSPHWPSVVHDIGGIMRHLNPSTLELEDCFVPRFAA